jgi:hypothetical protein
MPLTSQVLRFVDRESASSIGTVDKLDEVRGRHARSVVRDDGRVGQEDDLGARDGRVRDKKARQGLGTGAVEAEGVRQGSPRKDWTRLPYSRAEHAVDAERRLDQLRLPRTAYGELDRLALLMRRRRCCGRYVVREGRTLTVEAVSEVLPPAVVGQAPTDFGPPAGLPSAEDASKHASGQ